MMFVGMPVVRSSRFLLCFFAGSALVMGAAFAQSDWHQLLDEAENLDLRHEYRLAIAEYKRALAAIPSSQENARAKAEASLSLALLVTRQYDAACEYGKMAALSAQRLQAKKKLEPEVLFSLKSVFEACEQIAGEGLPVGSPLSAVRAVDALSQAVAPIFRKPGHTTAERIAKAQRMAGEKKYQQAERDLAGILQKDHPPEELSAQINMYIAVLEAKQGRKAAYDRLIRQYKNKYSEAAALRYSAEANLWLWDLAAAKTLVDEARARLTPGEWLEESKINENTYAICASKSDWTGAERCLRNNLDMLSRHKDAVKETDRARVLLAQLLRRLNRAEEAARLMSARNAAKEFEFLLTDEERAAVAKERSKSKSRLRQPAQKSLQKTGE
jgi:hypothetical protein